MENDFAALGECGGCKRLNELLGYRLQGSLTTQHVVMGYGGNTG
jgi:hypothetical protein